jgi:hypothetical protein
MATTGIEEQQAKAENAATVASLPQGICADAS